VAARVQEQASKLDKYFDRITSAACLLKRGTDVTSAAINLIRIELGVPGRKRTLWLHRNCGWPRDLLFQEQLAQLEPSGISISATM
jgi:hypothetical protein